MKSFFKSIYDNDLYTIITFIIINLAIRVYIFNLIPGDEDFNFDNDQSKYWRLSNYLLYEGKYFGLHWDVTRMPIYPIFLSLVRLVSDSVNFVIIIQNILFISASIIFYKIYKEIFTDRFTVLIAIFFTCINLNLIFASSFILTESIYVLFVSLFIYYFIKYLKDYDSKIKYVILLSLTLMLCYFTRPIAYYYIVLVFVFFTKEQNIKKCIRDVSIFFVFFIFFTSAWSFKNYHFHKKFSFNSSNGVFVSYYLPYLDQYKYDLSLKEAKEFRYKEYEDHLASKGLLNQKNKSFVLDQIEKDYFLLELKKYEFKHFFKFFLVGTLKNLISPTIIEFSYFLDIKKTSFSSISSSKILDKFKIYILDNENKFFSILLIVSIFFTLVKYLVSIYGLKMINKENYRIFIFFGLFILINLLLTSSFGSARYRLPYEILLIIIFSSGLRNLFKLTK